MLINKDNVQDRKQKNEKFNQTIMFQFVVNNLA